MDRTFTLGRNPSEASRLLFCYQLDAWRMTAHDALYPFWEREAGRAE